MQRPDLAKQKVKRILVFYKELESMKVTHEAAMEIMEYVFGVSSRWMEELLRKNSIEDYKDINLKYLDMDMVMIDALVSHIHKNARASRKDRNKQLSMFK